MGLVFIYAAFLRTARSNRSPFNSNRNYSVLFKDERGIGSEMQITILE